MEENPLIIALDFKGMDEVEAFLEPFRGQNLFVKVGMELFYKEGPNTVYRLKELGHRVFLDLKLHDIPNTVMRAMKSLAGLGCDLVTVHAAGGRAMMEAALEGLEAGVPSGLSRPSCVAVTQLTSTEEAHMKTEQLISVSLRESVYHYASLAKISGLDGVVCSAWEASGIIQRLGNGFLTVTPGIRMGTEDHQDQKRVATPEMARELGIHAIVVGRPIIRAANPVEAYGTWMKSWRGASQ
ncbi:orotidine-5'-phosphate decarboxylase [Neobacillus notoginsengisoli]|uniref:Orotidine 5'-phosphate decarboxylase n=1 Tax=Neobacillus notoginsengisoli TaxID=1578198 RepID=A0A417YQS7_9BACI|nr:orotidine-5'-phosphate decarboxylase [Neobacillus notoginsengisoli]RHW36471.1 orotidine-5'-phosphate decarboxylase [Neobacillus notoginsengisoli]